MSRKKTIFDLHRVGVEEFRRQAKIDLTLIVDNVRSLNNIGSLFRTADAFALRRIFLCGISSCPPSPEIHKTALGAEDSVEWHYFSTTSEAVETARRDGATICCLEQVEDSVELQDYAIAPDGSYALVIGHEVQGVDPAVVDMSDVCLEIPQRGTKHSLNVAVSMGIAAWQFFCRLTPRQSFLGVNGL